MPYGLFLFHFPYIKFLPHFRTFWQYQDIIQLTINSNNINWSIVEFPFDRIKVDIQVMYHCICSGSICWWPSFYLLIVLLVVNQPILLMFLIQYFFPSSSRLSVLDFLSELYNRRCTLINKPCYRKSFQRDSQSARPSKTPPLNVAIISRWVRVTRLCGVSQTRGGFARRRAAATECGT